MTAVLPMGLPAASMTYHFRTMLPLLAMNVDIGETSNFIYMKNASFKAFCPEKRTNGACCIIVRGRAGVNGFLRKFLKKLYYLLFPLLFS